MQQLRIARGRFQRVPNGMTEVENTAQAGFLFVTGNHVGFDLHSGQNDFLHGLMVAPANLADLTLHKLKKLAVTDDSALESFKQSGTKFPRVERFQDFRINQHSQGLMKCANQVFSCTEIDSGFSTDTCVHLRQQRRGNLHSRNSTHKDGSKETGAVADNASAERHYNGAAVRAGMHHLFRQRFHGCKPFRGLAIVHLQHIVIELGPAQRLLQRVTPMTPHCWRRHNKHSPRLRPQHAPDFAARVAQQSAADDHVIAALTGLNSDFSHLLASTGIITDDRISALNASHFLIDAALCYHSHSMKKVPDQVDFIVVGAGVAGLRAAIALAEAGKVLVLAKQELSESATQYAQGGIAVALSDEDEISLHLQDTINAGDGIVNVNAARVLVEEGPERIQELIDWGTKFDRNGIKLTFAREAAHSRSRVLHANGDSTGREIGRALYAKTSTLKNITVSEFEFTTGLQMDSNGVCGIELISAKGGPHVVRSSAVLLATGGAGQIYSNTTNPAVATADGIAMAFRAGAEISDMEFVQFHPTALYIKNTPRFLLSEALRGEGAVLRNSELLRFMPKYHQMGELAPRDVVARAIAHELEVSRMKDPVVYLDMTHLKEDHIKARFPRIYETCLKYNVDITIDQVPVRPAAHYLMGGVRTDLLGHSSLPGLYAAGEAACTGVHGANRLASNSLLEGLVFGARAGQTMRKELRAPASKAAGSKTSLTETEAAVSAKDKDAEQLIQEIQQLMWTKAGIVRSGQTLREAIEQLQGAAERIPPRTSRRACETGNIHAAALLIARSALAREESRGAHYRIDYPAPNDVKFKKHSVINERNVEFE